MTLVADLLLGCLLVYDSLAITIVLSAVDISCFW